MKFLLFAIVSLLPLTLVAAYHMGYNDGFKVGCSRCLAFNDGDTPSGAEVRR